MLAKICHLSVSTAAVVVDDGVVRCGDDVVSFRVATSLSLDVESGNDLAGSVWLERIIFVGTLLESLTFETSEKIKPSILVF